MMRLTFLTAGVFPGLYDHVAKSSDGTPNVTSATDLLTVIANVIRIAEAFAGALAVIFIVVGGIFYVISTGDPGRIKRAREIITQAITGLVIVSIAYTLTTFVAGRF